MIRRFYGVLAILLCLWPGRVWAQAVNTTALSVAAGLSDNSLTVTSVVGIAPGHLLLVDRETMTVTGVAGSVLTVQRNFAGLPGPHGAGAVVFSGPQGTFFSQPPPSLACSPSQSPSPYLNMLSGEAWRCSSVGAWLSLNVMPVGASGGVLMGNGATAPATFGTTQLTVGQGGTGLTSYTIGDMLYADTASSLAQRAAVASGSVLASAGTGTAPAWTAAPTLTTSVTTPILYGGVANTSTVTIQGTSHATPISGSDILFKSGATTIARINQNGAFGLNLGATGPAAWFDMASARADITGGNSMLIRDSTTIAEGVGGGISLIGKYTGSTYTPFASLAAYKDNATDGVYGASLGIYTRAAGSGGWTAKTNALMWLTSTQRVGILNQAPTTALDVTGTVTATTVAARFTTSGTAPTVAGTSMDSCGTDAPTVTGTNNAGKVTVGATSGTSCTVTFSSAWANAPACTVSNETTANLVRATSTTGTVILAGVFVAADKLAYICFP